MSGSDISSFGSSSYESDSTPLSPEPIKPFQSRAKESYSAKGKKIKEGREKSRFNLGAAEDGESSRMSIAAKEHLSKGSGFSGTLRKIARGRRYITYENELGTVDLNIKSLAKRLHLSKKELLKAQKRGDLEELVSQRQEEISGVMETYGRLYKHRSTLAKKGLSAETLLEVSKFALFLLNSTEPLPVEEGKILKAFDVGDHTFVVDTSTRNPSKLKISLLSQHIGSEFTLIPLDKPRKTVVIEGEWNGYQIYVETLEHAIAKHPEDLHSYFGGQVLTSRDIKTLCHAIDSGAIIPRESLRLASYSYDFITQIYSLGDKVMPLLARLARTAPEVLSNILTLDVSMNLRLYPNLIQERMSVLAHLLENLMPDHKEFVLQFLTTQVYNRPDHLKTPFFQEITPWVERLSRENHPLMLKFITLMSPMYLPVFGSAPFIAPLLRNYALQHRKEVIDLLCSEKGMIIFSEMAASEHDAEPLVALLTESIDDYPDEIRSLLFATDKHERPFHRTLLAKHPILLQKLFELRPEAVKEFMIYSDLMGAVLSFNRPPEETLKFIWDLYKSHPKEFLKMFSESRYMFSAKMFDNRVFSALLPFINELVMVNPRHALRLLTAVNPKGEQLLEHYDRLRRSFPILGKLFKTQKGCSLLKRYERFALVLPWIINNCGSDDKVRDVQRFLNESGLGRYVDMFNPPADLKTIVNRFIDNYGYFDIFGVNLPPEQTHAIAVNYVERIVKSGEIQTAKLQNSLVNYIIQTTSPDDEIFMHCLPMWLNTTPDNIRNERLGANVAEGTVRLLLRNDLSPAQKLSYAAVISNNRLLKPEDPRILVIELCTSRREFLNSLVWRVYSEGGDEKIKSYLEQTGLVEYLPLFETRCDWVELAKRIYLKYGEISQFGVSQRTEEAGELVIFYAEHLLNNPNSLAEDEGESTIAYMILHALTSANFTPDRPAFVPCLRFLFTTQNADWLASLRRNMSATPKGRNLALRIREGIRQLVLSERDQEVAKAYANLVLNNNLLHNNDPLLPEIVSLADLDPKDKKNPYNVFKRHLERVGRQLDVSPPTHFVSGVQAALSLQGLQALNEIFSVTKADIPPNATVENLRKLQQSFGAKLQQIQSFSGDFFQFFEECLNFEEVTGGVEPYKAQMAAILNWILSLDDKIPDDGWSIFTPQQQALVDISQVIIHCLTGRRENINIIYVQLPPEFKFAAKGIEGDESVRKGKEAALLVISTCINYILLTDTRLLSEVTGQKIVNQESHQIEYLKNSIGYYFGLGKNIAFDQHTHLLSQKLLDHTQKGILTIVLRHITPERLAKEMIAISRDWSEIERRGGKGSGSDTGLNPLIGSLLSNSFAFWTHDDYFTPVSLNMRGALEVLKRLGLIETDEPEVIASWNSELDLNAVSIPDSPRLKLDGEALSASRNPGYAVKAQVFAFQEAIMENIKGLTTPCRLVYLLRWLQRSDSLKGTLEIGVPETLRPAFREAWTKSLQVIEKNYASEIRSLFRSKLQAVHPLSVVTFMEQIPTLVKTLQIADDETNTANMRQILTDIALESLPDHVKRYPALWATSEGLNYLIKLLEPDNFAIKTRHDQNRVLDIARGEFPLKLWNLFKDKLFAFTQDLEAQKFSIGKFKDFCMEGNLLLPDEDLQSLPDFKAVSAEFERMIQLIKEKSKTIHIFDLNEAKSAFDPLAAKFGQSEMEIVMQRR